MIPLQRIKSLSTRVRQKIIKRREGLKRLLKLPKWAWTVSGMPGIESDSISPRHVRWALVIALKLRRVYYPIMSFRIVLLTLIALILCYLIPEQHTGLNHIFVVSSAVASIQVLTVIIGALAAILAVIFSVVLLVLGVLRNYAYRGKLSDVFSYYPLRELLLFYATVVLSSLYVLATIHDSLSIRDIHFLFPEIYLFVVAIIALFPATKKLIDFTDPASTVPEQIKNIKANVAQFGRFSISGDSEIIPAEIAHPIFALRDIAIKSLAENDEVTTIQIINSMSERLEDLLKDEAKPEERRLIIGAFLLVWRSLMLRAVRSENEGVLLSILDAIRATNRNMSKRDSKWFEALELNRFHSELINKALEAEYEEVATRGVYLLGAIFEWNIPNIPPASELFMYWSRKRQTTEKGNTDKDLKWEHLISDFIGLLGSANSAAVKYKNEVVARNAISNLSNLIPKIEGATQLSDKQKGAIIAQISWAIRHGIIEALENLNITQSFLFIPGLDDYAVRDVMVSNKNYSKFPIIFYKDIFRKAIEKDLLSGFTLDSLRMAAFSLSDKLKQGSFDKVKKILFFLVVLLNDVREKTEDPSSEQARECYLAAYDKLKSIQEIVKDLHDNELDNEIKGTLGKFKDITKLQSMQSHYDELW